MRFFISILVLLGLSQFSWAEGGRLKDFVQIRRDRALFVDYVKESNSAPVLVLLNGLTNDLEDYNFIIPHLVGNGYSILRYDPWGMGKTLLANGMPKDDITIDSQAQDLKDLLAKLKINKPVYLLGLSYGGGLALKFASLYPNQVKEMILLSSFVSPRNSAPSNQDEIIKGQINWVRTYQPWNKSTDEELYNYFLRILVYQTYPSAEPEVLSNPYKLEATYRLIQGIRKLYTDDLVDSWPQKSIHFIIADQDQYVPRQMFEDFWKRLKPGQGISRLNINGSEHKITVNVPKFISAWVNLIMAGDKRIRDGRVFQGNAYNGKAISNDNVSIDLPSDYTIFK